MSKAERISDYQSPSGPRLERKRDHKRPGQIADYVIGAIAEFRAGERSDLPALRDIAETFGTSNLAVVKTLRNRGIYPTLEAAYREANIVYPSNEWAWMLGILALGGSASPHNMQISLASADPDLLKAFSLRGANLFHSNPITNYHSVQSDGRESKKVIFGNSYMINALGDLRKESWPSTISERHGWIYDDDEYIWSFLEGACEVRGHFSNKPSKRRILINTNFPHVANTISDLLVRVGVEQPRVRTDSSAREGIRGVEIDRIDDVRFITSHIHSVSPKREEILKQLRESEIKSPARVSSLDEVQTEWVRLKNLLGRTPNSSDILRLKQSGDTPYSFRVYLNWSGEDTWLKAASFFEDMTEIKEYSE